MSIDQRNATKKRILQVCVRLFLEQGYKKTTMMEIIEKAKVSSSSFQNIFRAKDGVLVELVKFMFSNQFGAAAKHSGKELPALYIYAAETAIQLTLTDMNENLREIYTEAYTHEEAREYIYTQTAKVLQKTFAEYLPDCDERDFYEMEIGSAGIMRSYMQHPCDEQFTPQRKLHRFLTMTLRAYNVPKDEIDGVLAFIDSLDIRKIANEVMLQLFRALALQYDFSLDGLVDPQVC